MDRLAQQAGSGSGRPATMALQGVLGERPQSLQGRHATALLFSPTQARKGREHLVQCVATAFKAKWRSRILGEVVRACINTRGGPDETFWPTLRTVVEALGDQVSVLPKNALADLLAHGDARTRERVLEELGEPLGSSGRKVRSA